jgi:single-stranded DNA-binding protein
MDKTKIESEAKIGYIPTNEVFLVGRVTSLALAKILPSGDQVVEFRIVIDRAKSSRVKSEKREVDSLDIAAWSPKLRKKALVLKVGDWIEVHGAVRRRFWQAPSGLASRWQVEAEEIIRL